MKGRQHVGPHLDETKIFGVRRKLLIGHPFGQFETHRLRTRRIERNRARPAVQVARRTGGFQVDVRVVERLDDVVVRREIGQTRDRKADGVAIDQCRLPGLTWSTSTARTGAAVTPVLPISDLGSRFRARRQHDEQSALGTRGLEVAGHHDFESQTGGGLPRAGAHSTPVSCATRATRTPRRMVISLARGGSTRDPGPPILPQEWACARIDDEACTMVGLRQGT